MAKIHFLSGSEIGKTVTLKGDLYLGRFSEKEKLASQNYYISDIEVSRRHLKIFKSDGEVFVQDLNSTNGTTIQDIKIRPGVVYSVKDNDEVLIGSTRILISEENDSVPDSGFESFSNVEIVEHDLDSLENISEIMDASKIFKDLSSNFSSGISSDEENLRKLTAMAQVSISLGSIKDRVCLLDKIVESIFSIFSHADCMQLLFVENRSKKLQLVKNSSQNAKNNIDDKVKISRSIVNEVISNRKSLLIMDALDDSRFKTKQSVVDMSMRSVMCVPLIYQDTVLGLINLTSVSVAGLFTKTDLEVLTGIAAQISISLKNSQLFDEIEGLFEGFVVASVQAIETRDPTTAGHSFRVAEYTENLAIAVDNVSDYKYSDIKFDSNELKEIRYAALLHDFGKVGVREGVLTKEKKLYGHEVDYIKNRFKYARACLEKKLYQQLIDKHIYEGLSKDDFLEYRENIEKEIELESLKFERYLKTIITTNEPSVQFSDVPLELNDIVNYKFLGIKGEELSLINNFEFSKLSLARGSLNPEERIEIESHVNHTYAFLTLIPWSNFLTNVPNIAYAHHEKLDGSGYPRGLNDDQIPIQSKIMTIADIYDALTAGDRPYKQGMSSIQALDILYEEANNHKLDSELLRIFIESKSYKLNLNN